jgi:hypothetical protein
MAGRGTLFTMTFMIARMTCGRSRAINGKAQLLELCRGVKFKDGEAIKDN